MLTAAQINRLREKTRTELARRGGFGSLAGFAGTAYDFETMPQPGGRVLAEHGQKTINPLLAVADIPGLVLVGEESPEGVVPSKKGDPIPGAFNESLLNQVEALAAEPMQGAQSSFRGACSVLFAGSCVLSCSGFGFCYGSATGGCNGCSSACKSCTGCDSGCTGGCRGSCTGCSGGSGGCDGCIGCSGQCTTGCVSGCAGCSACSGGCNGCSGCSGCSGCGSSCAGGCSGCSGCGSGCSGGCGGGCAATCGTTCTATCYGNCQGQCYGTAAAAVSA